MTHRELPTRIALLPLLALLGCNDAGGDDETALSAGASESTSESESETGPVPESLAHDIDIDVVEINQGVATPIAVAGTWVDGAARNAPIVANRDSLLRAYWTLAPSFEPREILARLTLTSPTLSEPLVREQILAIEGEPFAGDISRSFTFDITAELMQPGLTFSLSLWEVDPTFALLPAPALPPISPRDGNPAQIGVQSEPMAIEVVIVPHEAQWAGCSTQVPIDEVLGGLEDFLYMKNPTQSVTLSVRDEPIVVTEEPPEWFTLLPAIQDARTADQAEPNVYYYGILDSCGISLGGYGGVSWNIVSDQKASAIERVSVGMHLPDDLQFTYDTFVHEIGHLQGLAHVFCPGGNAASPDPAYPYEDGVIGVWGFGVRDFKLRNPTASHDYMSYCYSGNWTSDWTWSKTFNRIRTLTSWDFESPSPDASEPGTLLFGVFGPDGARWYTQPGTLPAAKLARERVAVRSVVDGVTRDSLATWHRAPHGETEVLTVELDADARVPEWLDTPRGLLQPAL